MGKTTCFAVHGSQIRAAKPTNETFRPRIARRPRKPAAAGKLVAANRPPGAVDIVPVRPLKTSVVPKFVLYSPGPLRPEARHAGAPSVVPARMSSPIGRLDCSEESSNKVGRSVHRRAGIPVAKRPLARRTRPGLVRCGRHPARLSTTVARHPASLQRGGGGTISAAGGKTGAGSGTWPPAIFRSSAAKRSRFSSSTTLAKSLRAASLCPRKRK